MARWLTRLRVTLRTIVRRRRADSELTEELQFHLDRDIHEGVKAGLTLEAARRAALHTLGAIEASKEECRDLRAGWGVASAGGRLVRDMRFALRLFRRHPAPVGIAVTGLALAIGVVTAVFSIADASLLRPYNIDAPSTVVNVSSPGHPAWVGWPYPAFLRMGTATALTAVEAARPDRVRFSLRRNGEDVPNRPILFVSGGYLSMLGGRPALGRALGPADDRPGAPPVVVVSDRFWRTELDGDPLIVGKTVWLNSAAVTLVGVLRPDFAGPIERGSAGWALWATLSSSTDVVGAPPAAGGPVQVIARLAPGVSLRVAQDNLNALVQRDSNGSEGTPSGRPREVWIYSGASPVAELTFGDTLPILVSVGGLVGLILALACANAANLLMASAVTRMREVGVRLAMGATRGRLVAQMLHESLLLGLIAGSLGLLLAFWLVPIFARLADVPLDLDVAPDGRVLLFTVAVALICGLGAGLAPARHGARGRVVTTLQAQSGSRGSMIPSRLRTAFVGFQAAVSMLLLVCAALLARSSATVASAEIGFDADRLIGVSLSAPRSDFEEAVYVRTALDAVRGIPSVERVSLAQTYPFGWTVERARITYEGRSFRLNVIRSDAEVFTTLGVRVLRGRPFTTDEVTQEAPVALISASVARTFFGGRDPIGQALSNVPATGHLQLEPATIIGVTTDALLSRIDSQDYGTLYRPISRQRINPASLLVRTSTPNVAARAIEETLRRIDPRVQPTTRLVRDGIDAYVNGTRQLAVLLAPGAVLALLLAGLGLYGVTAFIVSQRMEEMSVRMALGASSADIAKLLVGGGLRPVAIGLAVGLGLALLAGRVMAGELSGISPHDPVATVGALVVLLACSFTAVIVPARRAARSNPAALLRRS